MRISSYRYVDAKWKVVFWRHYFRSSREYIIIPVYNEEENIENVIRF